MCPSFWDTLYYIYFDSIRKMYFLERATLSRGCFDGCFTKTSLQLCAFNVWRLMYGNLFTSRHTYYKPKKSASHRYFDLYFMHIIREVSGIDNDMIPYLCNTYVGKESCQRLSETPPVLCIKHA